MTRRSKRRKPLEKGAAVAGAGGAGRPRTLRARWYRALVILLVVSTSGESPTSLRRASPLARSAMRR